MPITTTLWQNKNKLIQSFHDATIHGILDTWQRCGNLGTKPQEPDFVAGLVLESTPLILNALTSVLSSSRISVSMSAVFCHQSPKVTFNGPQTTCELGDILIAYVHTPKVGQVRRNAILFQAKATATQPYQIKSTDTDQLRLYTDWPDFVYNKSPPFLSGHKRFVTPKTPHSGGQYLLIVNSHPTNPSSGLQGHQGTYPVGCCIPDNTLYHHADLASELFNLLIFRTGRPFEDKNTAATKKDWSLIVWDILETGINKAFNRKNSERRNSPRGIANTIQMLDGSFFAKASSMLPCSTVAEIIGQDRVSSFYKQDSGVPPYNRDRLRDTDEPEAGVSVVLIETSELESEG